MLLCLASTLLLSSCTASPTTDNGSSADSDNTGPVSTQSEDVDISVVWDDEDTNGTPDISGATVITLADGNTAVNGDGAAVNGSVVTVTQAGCYVVSGTLSNGQLRVESEGDGAVLLVLDGVYIHSDTTAPLFIRKSAKTIITLAGGSQNTLSDSADAVYEDEENQEPSGALFSKSDLTVNGDGQLTVTANFNDGIVSRDGLKIAGGKVNVTAADDAVMGRDYVLVGGGELTLTANGDGIKSTNDAGETVGFVSIEDGFVAVDSEADGIQAESFLSISGGKVTVTSGGGSVNGTANAEYDFGWGMSSVDSSSGGKSLKAGLTLSISGGELQLDAADDAIHSNDTVLISGGTITAAAGDDGVHADSVLTVSNGSLTLTKSYEGLEAKTITIDGGELSITASDDGVNASSGSSETSGDRGMGGDPFAADDSAFIINGGSLSVDAQGDGLDSNGVITMNGGTVYVTGPSNSGNGTFDYASAMNIRGGTLIAVGSIGMAQTPSLNTQESIVWSGCSMNSSDVFAVTASDGTCIAQITATRTAQWAYITSDSLKEGEEYTVSCGGDSQTLTLVSGGNAIGNAYGGMGGGMGVPGGMGGGMGRPGNRGW